MKIIHSNNNNSESDYKDHPINRTKEVSCLVEDGIIKDDNGRTIGYAQNGILYDKGFNRKGFYENGKIYSRDGSLQGYYEINESNK